MTGIISKLLSAIVLPIVMIPSLLAEQGILVLFVTDVSGRPVNGCKIGLSNTASVAVAVQGKARLQLPTRTQPGDWIFLTLSDAKKELAIISPWNNRIEVPSFRNSADNYASVVVAHRADKELLKNPDAMKSFISQINSRETRSSKDDERTGVARTKALAAVASAYGLSPEDVDHAIRLWADKVQDPYERGLAALYAHDYGRATELLAASVRLRSSKADKSSSNVTDGAYFWGRALMEAGNFQEAIKVYQEANKARPNDVFILDALALAYVRLGNLRQAEALYRVALQIVEENPGNSDPIALSSISIDLAAELQERGDYNEAEIVARRAVELARRNVAETSPLWADHIRTLAGVLQAKGQYAEAEVLARRALTIRREFLREKRSHRGEGP